MSATIRFFDSSRTQVRAWDYDDDINMSNANANTVLAALGLNPVRHLFYCEPVPVQELHAACTRFLTSDIAAYVDTGVPVTEGRGASGAHWIDCGRRPDYITCRVQQIQAQAAAAMLAGAMHVLFD